MVGGQQKGRIASARARFKDGIERIEKALRRRDEEVKTIVIKMDETDLDIRG